MNSCKTRDTDIVLPWQAPPGVLTLQHDEVHVWRASLQMAQSRIETLSKVLSSDELCRAARFHFQKNRDHFMVGRALLRVILARYKDVEPSELRFVSGLYGKPFLDNSFHKTELSFNLSHSQDFALYAIVKNRQVGVDIEYFNKKLQCRDLVERFFSAKEKDLWNSAPKEKSHEVFFSCWTRKEALLKAMGVGLSVDPRTIDTAPDELICRRKPDHGSETQHWSIVDFDPGFGYMAALAVEGEGWQRKYWQFSGY